MYFGILVFSVEFVSDWPTPRTEQTLVLFLPPSRCHSCFLFWSAAQHNPTTQYNSRDVIVFVMVAAPALNTPADPNFDAAQFDWVQLKKEFSVLEGETRRDRFLRKINENPIVPIGKC